MPVGVSRADSAAERGTAMSPAPVRRAPVSGATSKGPPFCHQLGTTSVVVGRVLIVV